MKIWHDGHVGWSACWSRKWKIFIMVALGFALAHVFLSCLQVFIRLDDNDCGQRLVYPNFVHVFFLVSTKFAFCRLSFSICTSCLMKVYTKISVCGALFLPICVSMLVSMGFDGCDA